MEHPRSSIHTQEPTMIARTEAKGLVPIQLSSFVVCCRQSYNCCRDRTWLYLVQLLHNTTWKPRFSTAITACITYLLSWCCLLVVSLPAYKHTHHGDVTWRSSNLLLLQCESTFETSSVVLGRRTTLLWPLSEFRHNSSIKSI